MAHQTSYRYIKEKWLYYSPSVLVKNANKCVANECNIIYRQNYFHFLHFTLEDTTLTDFQKDNCFKMSQIYFNTSDNINALDFLRIHA